jgi:hypothetical protein
MTPADIPESQAGRPVRQPVGRNGPGIRSDASSRHGLPRKRDHLSRSTDTDPALQSPEIHVATIDDQGRLAFHGPATTMGWSAGEQLRLDAMDGTLRLYDASGDGLRAHPGLRASLDRRCRIQIPYGLRMSIGFDPGVRVMTLAAPHDRIAVALALHRLISTLRSTA